MQSPSQLGRCRIDSPAVAQCRVMTQTSGLLSQRRRCRRMLRCGCWPTGGDGSREQLGYSTMVAMPGGGSSSSNSSVAKYRTVYHSRWSGRCARDVSDDDGGCRSCATSEAESIPLSTLDFNKEVCSKSSSVGCQSVQCVDSYPRKTQTTGEGSRERPQFPPHRNLMCSTSGEKATGTTTAIRSASKQRKMALPAAADLAESLKDKKRIGSNMKRSIGNVLPSVVVVLFDAKRDSNATSVIDKPAVPASADRNETRTLVSCIHGSTSSSNLFESETNSAASFECSSSDAVVQSPTWPTAKLPTAATSATLRPDTKDDVGFRLLVVPSPRRQVIDLRSTSTSDVTDASIKSESILSRGTSFDDVIVADNDGTATIADTASVQHCASSVVTASADVTATGDRILPDANECLDASCNSAMTDDTRRQQRNLSVRNPVKSVSMTDQDSSLRRKSISPWRRRTEIKRRGLQDRKAARTLSAILLVFIVTWTPYNLFTVIQTFSPMLINPTLYAIGEHTFFSNGRYRCSAVILKNCLCSVIVTKTACEDLWVESRSRSLGRVSSESDLRVNVYNMFNFLDKKSGRQGANLMVL